MLLGRVLCEVKAVMMGAKSLSANCADYKAFKSCPNCCWITDIIGSVEGRQDSISAILCIFPEQNCTWKLNFCRYINLLVLLRRLKDYDP